MRGPHEKELRVVMDGEIMVIATVMVMEGKGKEGVQLQKQIRWPRRKQPAKREPRRLGHRRRELKRQDKFSLSLKSRLRMIMLQMMTMMVLLLMSSKSQLRKLKPKTMALLGPAHYGARSLALTVE